jgi:hypothetical protein
MSRHTVKDPKGREFTYGYDRPLQYYFLSYDRNRAGTPVYHHLVGLLSPVYGSASNLLEWIDRYKIAITPEHRRLLMLDLPV